MGTITTHAELVQLIGEIDSISLESEPNAVHEELQDVVVYLEINHCRVELIRACRTGVGIISHRITRVGIQNELDNQGLE